MSDKLNYNCTDYYYYYYYIFHIANIIYLFTAKLEIYYIRFRIKYNNIL